MSSPATYSEQELVGSLRQRTDSSFSYLYDNYSGALYGVIAAIIPDPEIARDVLQEVFVNIWRKIDTYDPIKGRLFTWMINIARNASIDKIRSRGYQDSLKNNPITGNEDIGLTGGTGLPGTTDVGLKKILASMKEEHRSLLDLSYFQGYTHEEIAKLMNIPLGTVKTRIRAALIQLRTLIK